jgi:hypothetical protein
VTDKDTDPETGEKRQRSDEPPMARVSDFKNNIWWLNLGSKG